ncbi:MAG: folate family ECF transporter S component [Clostridia bacterium]|nr:folate family ECF transporter S component [Clostridia bacterium]
MKKFNPVVCLCVCALLTALEIVLNRFGSINTLGLKIGFAFVPPVTAAILYGPGPGALVWALSDLIGALLFPIGPYHPGFTVCAALMGAICGFFLNRDPVDISRESEKGSFVFRISRKNIPLFPNVVIPVLFNCLVLGLVVNTAWVSMLYGKKTYWGWFLYRLGEYGILVPVQLILIPVLIRVCDSVKKRMGKTAFYKRGTAK